MPQPGLAVKHEKNSDRVGLSDEEFIQLRDLIHERTGIFLEARRKMSMENAVMERLREQKLNSCFEYYYTLRFGDSKEWDYLISKLIIPETRFFRNVPLWHALEQDILPQIIELKRASHQYTLNIWSAGCSTGEEAYTLAMLVCKVIPDPQSWNIKIWGGDICKLSLAKALQGIYEERSMVEMTEADKARFFENTKGHFIVNQSVRKYVTFESQNLIEIEKLESLPQMDIIICANVMMYFSETARNRLLEFFSKKLNSDGYLFTGWAEILDVHKTPFTLKFLRGAMCYQLERGQKT